MILVYSPSKIRIIFKVPCFSAGKYRNTEKDAVIL